MTTSPATAPSPQPSPGGFARKKQAGPKGLGDRLRDSWHEFYGVLTAPDFVVDEQPVILKKSPTAMDVSTASLMRDGGGVDAAGRPITGGAEMSRDLVSLISSMMRREEKARKEAEAMKNAPPPIDNQVMSLMRSMIPFLDSFDQVLTAARAMPTTEENTNWTKSLESLYFRVLKILERFGMVQMRTVGQVVNLDIHDVVEYRVSPNHPADTVIAERQKGYVFNNRLLRDAKVVVAQSNRSR